MTPPPQKESRVRWFGRSEDDPNALLIIEDEHSRVFLDAEHREELYSVIKSRSHPTPAPSPQSPICDRCRTGIEPFCIGCDRLQQHDTAIRNATLDDVREALSHIRFQEEDLWFVEAAQKKIESLRTEAPKEQP
jgi:predicted Fe-S protein YdhL (DUF1289 family)